MFREAENALPLRFCHGRQHEDDVEDSIDLQHALQLFSKTAAPTSRRSASHNALSYVRDAVRSRQRKAEEINEKYEVREKNEQKVREQFVAVDVGNDSTCGSCNHNGFDHDDHDHTNSASNTERPKKRRRVQFGPSNMIAPSALTGMDPKLSFEEYQKLWYSRRDLKNMKTEAKECCAGINLDSEFFFVSATTTFSGYDNQVLPSEDESNSSHCSDADKAKAYFLSNCKNFERQRGLERWSSNHHLFSRCVSIVTVRTEVLLEQSNQLIHGKCNPERLATIYKAATSASVHNARVLGLADAALCDKL